MKGSYLIALLGLFFTFNSNAQCGAGQIELTITTGGAPGGAVIDNELWFNITTAPNGGGTAVVFQGNGTIGNNAGPVIGTACVTVGNTYYFNAYDEYADSWNGATYSVSVCGTVIANNNGNSPNDSFDNDLSGVWEQTIEELEVSEAFTPLSTVKADFCEDDAVQNLCATANADGTSGKSGMAVILVTDEKANEITFNLFDLGGAPMSTQATFPGAPATLANNTVYVIFNNPCYDVATTAGIPGEMNLLDSGADGISDNTASLSGAGLYIYYYAADAIENITNDVDSDGKNYIIPGTGGFPGFYTAATNQRTNGPTHTGDGIAASIIIPSSTSHEYVSSGVWSGVGVTNNGTVSKTYFSGLAGLERTITINSGSGQFDPSAAPVGANNNITYTYNSVVGFNGPADCSVANIKTSTVDVHAKPTITPVLDQVCNGAPYDVTLNIDLGTYNVSVDEDGGTDFTITGTGGTLSNTTLAGTGVTQVTISNIPNGDTWSLNVNDVSGLSCGLVGTNGNCITVLPIELVKFNAYKNSKGTVTIEWQTESEIDNDFFTVESSVDGLNWREVKRVEGAGNSSRKLNYSILDKEPKFDIIYYRLKQTDYNGNFSYSDIKSVRFDKLNTNEFLVYPNPTDEFIYVIANNFQLNDVMVYNTLGQDVSNVIQFEQIANGYKLSVNELQAGVYFIKTDHFSTRFVKK